MVLLANQSDFSSATSEYFLAKYLNIAPLKDSRESATAALMALCNVKNMSFVGLQSLKLLVEVSGKQPLTDEQIATLLDKIVYKDEKSALLGLTKEFQLNPATMPVFWELSELIHYLTLGSPLAKGGDAHDQWYADRIRAELRDGETMVSPRLLTMIGSPTLNTREISVE